MVLIQNFMSGGDNYKMKFGLDMLPSQNRKKINFFGVDTIPLKTLNFFENIRKTLIKNYKSICNKIVPKVGISIIFLKKVC